MPEALAATQSPSSSPLPDRGTVLAFDFGLARIGVACGELETGMANPLDTIHGEAGDLRFAAIGRLISEWRPVLLVVGLPLALDGSEHALTLRCRRFANQLHGRHALPVQLIDERLTSVEAESRLRGVPSRRGGKGRIDAVAAQIFLQNFLDNRNHAAT